MDGWTKKSVKYEPSSFALLMVGSSEKTFDGLRCENECPWKYLQIPVFHINSILFLVYRGLYCLYSPLPGEWTTMDLADVLLIY